METPKYNPQSELTAEEQERVHAHPYTQEDYKKAWAELRSLEMGMANNAQVAMAAKLIGALPEMHKERGAEWLIIEMYHMLGDD